MSTQPLPISSPEEVSYPEGWYDYTLDKSPDEHTVTGNVEIYRDFYSPQLDNTRDIWVYLPPSYLNEQGRRYPVLYMHDGQNLFDAAVSFGGKEWEVDETMEKLAEEGIEAIVVGLSNTPDRMREYAPYPLSMRGETVGNGDKYIRFIVETVKPEIDSTFRTLPDVNHTGIAGSSLGGLISLYGFFAYPHVFSMAGIFSPAMEFDGGKIYGMIRHAPFVNGRLYLDVGTREGYNIGPTLKAQQMISEMYLLSFERLCTVLRGKGYLEKHDMKIVLGTNALHNEAEWAKRLPDALRFLLG